MSAEKTWINPLADWSSDPEEAANTITHGLGLLLSLVGSVVMIIWAVQGGDRWRVVGCSIYVAMLVAVYAMSTLSHACSEPKQKRFYEMLDQAFIYLLIVGTYTPFVLTYLRAAPWWGLLAVLWSIAFFGFFSKLLRLKTLDKTSVWLHLVLGWAPIISVPALIGRLPTAGLWWMLVGGLCYSIGTIFLVFDRHVRHFHALWHLLVIAGSASHYFVILFAVAATTT